MATEQRTQRRAQPIAGTRPNIRLDQQLADDLALLMTDGSSLTDAVRDAVHLVAELRRQAADDLDVVMQTADGLTTAVRDASVMYRTAWLHRVVPVGTVPTLDSFKFAEKPPTPGPSPLPWAPSSSATSADDARRQATPTPARADRHPGPVG
ncbi:hypothetical protein [Streptomyces niveiscabiei]|uniref:Uncharacterized protein n=1 Tax=Streptomyces niveiscabiei TaxID=164115 RepID=A0ABW9I0L9_9ACTN